MPVLQDDALGVYGVLTWAPNMDNPHNKKFVAEYEAAYNAVPASYAMQAYDAAMLINSAVDAVKGNLVGPEGGAAPRCKKADFKSLRGPFKFNANGYPIEDFYLTKVAKRADGKYQTEIVEKIFSNHADGYAKDCKHSVKKALFAPLTAGAYAHIYQQKYFKFRYFRLIINASEQIGYGRSCARSVLAAVPAASISRSR